MIHSSTKWIYYDFFLLASKSFLLFLYCCMLDLYQCISIYLYTSHFFTSINQHVLCQGTRLDVVLMILFWNWPYFDISCCKALECLHFKQISRKYKQNYFTSIVCSVKKMQKIFASKVRSVKRCVKILHKKCIQ